MFCFTSWCVPGFSCCNVTRICDKKTRRLCVLMGSDLVRLGLFSTGWFPFKYGHYCSMACYGVLSGYWTGQQVLPDKTLKVTFISIGQDGKRPQDVERHYGRFPGGRSHSQDQEWWRFSEISNMFDILPTHHDKPGNHNQP